MKANKMAAVVAAGLLTFGAMFSASAAGIGYVNTAVVMQSHPKSEKAQLDMKSAEQKAQEEFKKKAEGKSEAEQQKAYQEVQRELALKVRGIFQPIQQDVLKAIQQVRKDKGLDVILEQGAVIDGGSDVTNDVIAKLK